MAGVPLALRKTPLFSKGYIPLWVAWALYVIGVLLLSRTPFFWDSVSVLSRPATVLYDNGFSSLAMPKGTVSDNLPLSMLLAAWWMLFGRTLFSTHLLFAFFGMALIYQVFMLCRDWVGRREARPFVFFLMLSDTTLLTQMLFPMFDAVMMLFALICLRGILSGNKAQVAAGAFFLAMLRSRGVILCAGLALFAFLYALAKEKPGWRRGVFLLGRTFLEFLPAFVAAVVLLFVQVCNQEAVFGMGADSPWRIAFPSRILGNAVSFGLFWLDFGKVFLWIALITLLLRFGWRRFWQAVPKPLAGFYGLASLLFFLMTVPFLNSYGGRYFLLLYILTPLLTGILLFAMLPVRLAKSACVVLSVLMLVAHSGCFSVMRVKQWDCSLAHLPYYGLRNQALAYLQEKGAEPARVRSFFPADKPQDLIDLKRQGDSAWCFEPFSVEEEAEFVLYSNLSNMLDRAKAGIGASYVLEKRFEKASVYIEIWRRR